MAGTHAVVALLFVKYRYLHRNADLQEWKKRFLGIPPCSKIFLFESTLLSY